MSAISRNKKRLNIKLFLIFILIFIFIAFVSMAENKDADIFGKVTFVSGDVKIIKFNSNEYLKLNINTIILLGDTIETGKESKAEILLTDNKTKVIIMENTKVKLSSLINPEKKKQTIISVFFGSISSIVQKLTGSSTFVIQTPNGSASVRGTEFSVVVSDTMDTLVSVSDGVVAYQKDEDSKPVDITKDQYCITEIDTNPQISSGALDYQVWLNDRNNQFEQNSAQKSAFIVANLLNIVKTIGNLIYAVNDFTRNSLIFKLLTKKLSPLDIMQFMSQKGPLLQRVYDFYYKLNLYDTIILGFYRFFDFLSRFNSDFNEQKERCWNSHIELSKWIYQIVQLYKAIWFFY